MEEHCGLVEIGGVERLAVKRGIGAGDGGMQKAGITETGLTARFLDDDLVDLIDPQEGGPQSPVRLDWMPLLRSSPGKFLKEGAIAVDQLARKVLGAARK